MQFLRCLLLLAAVAACASCESSTTVGNQPFDSTIVNATDRALFIVCEGNGHQNGSFDALVLRHTPKADTIDHLNILQGEGLPNDVDIIGNRAYVLENQTGILDIIDADSLKKIGSISLGQTNPNKMTRYGANSFLLTERGASRLLVVDVAQHAVVDSVTVGTNAAEIGMLSGKAFVTISPYLLPGAIEKVDVGNHQVLQTLPLVSAPEILLVDSAHNQLIVGSVGDYAQIKPVIYFIDPATMAVKDSIQLPDVASLSSMILGDRLYALIDNDVIPIDLTTHAMQPGLLTSKKVYYDGIYDAKTNQLFLGPLDYDHAVSIDVVDETSGNVKWSFPAGIATGAFAFYH